MVLLSILTLLAGLVIFAYYKDCDPVSEGRIKSGGQLLPLFVVETMGRYPGLSGILRAYVMISNAYLKFLDIQLTKHT